MSRRVARNRRRPGRAGRPMVVCPSACGSRSTAEVPSIARERSAWTGADPGPSPGRPAALAVVRWALAVGPRRVRPAPLGSRRAWLVPAALGASAPPSGSGSTRRRVALGRRGQHGPEHRRAPARRASWARSTIARSPRRAGSCSRRLAVLVFGEGEHALRLIPLLGSLAALPLGWQVARRVLPPGLGPPLALGLLATGIPFIFYAAQAKPYSTDVAVALLLIALALAVEQHGTGQGRALRLGVAGARRAVALVPRDARRRRSPPGRSRPWRRSCDRDRARRDRSWRRGARVRGERARRRALGAGHRDADDALYMQRFWARDFMPLPPRELRDLGWPVARLTTVYGGGGLRYPAPGTLPGPGGGGRLEALATRPSRRGSSSCPSLATFGRPRSTSIRSSRGWCSSSFRPSYPARGGGAGGVGRLRRVARRRAGRGRRDRMRSARPVRARAESAALRARAAQAGAPDDAAGVAARRPRLRLLRRGEGVPLLRAAVRLRARATTSSAAAPGRTRASTCASSTRSAAAPRRGWW